MKNLTLKKIIATLGITTLALTATNVASAPVNTLAVTEKAITVSDNKIEEAHFSIDAADGQTFANVLHLDIEADDGYRVITSTNGKDPQWYGVGNEKNNTGSVSNLTQTTTVKVKCVKKSSNEKTLAKRFAKAKVYTYKFNVINTGVSVEMQGKVRNYGETVVDGMNVYADFAGITLGYPGKALTYSKYNALGYYRGKGKVYSVDDKRIDKVSTKKYDKKYAKLATQTLYYTLDGSTPTTNSKKVAAGKLKTIKVTNPGLNTLKVMGAKEKKVYTYTFYVDTVTATTVDVPEANVYACSTDGLRSFYVTPQNVSVTAYKYFKTYFGVDVYKDATKGSTHEKIAVEAGTTMEIPYNYFEGKGIRYTGHSTFDN